MEYLLAFLLGWILSTQYFAYKLRKFVRQLSKEHNIDLDTEKSDIIPIYITEFHENVILLYDSKNNFLCQGNTLEDLAENLLKYQKVKFAIINHENKNLWFIDGKIKESENES